MVLNKVKKKKGEDEGVKLHFLFEHCSFTQICKKRKKKTTNKNDMNKNDLLLNCLSSKKKKINRRK